MTCKYAQTILLLDAIRNEKTEIDGDRQVDIRLQLQDLSRDPQKQVKIIMIYIPYLSLIYLRIIVTGLCSCWSVY